MIEVTVSVVVPGKFILVVKKEKGTNGIDLKKNADIYYKGVAAPLAILIYLFIRTIFGTNENGLKQQYWPQINFKSRL